MLASVSADGTGEQVYVGTVSSVLVPIAITAQGGILVEGTASSNAAPVSSTASGTAGEVEESDRNSIPTIPYMPEIGR